MIDKEDIVECLVRLECLVGMAPVVHIKFLPPAPHSYRNARNMIDKEDIVECLVRFERLVRTASVAITNLFFAASAPLLKEHPQHDRQGGYCRMFGSN